MSNEIRLEEDEDVYSGWVVFKGSNPLPASRFEIELWHLLQHAKEETALFRRLLSDAEKRIAELENKELTYVETKE